MTRPRGSTPIARKYRTAPARVLRFAVLSSAPLRDAAALTLPAAAAWSAGVDVDVAPAPPVTIATAAATATSVKILVHPNMRPPHLRHAAAAAAVH
ncbi:MAG TPA: hypothetical protein VIM33_15590 [Gaiellaceae bacterium]|jgi:hypothetical protein